MLKYNKYIMWKIISSTIVICFTLTGIAWLTQSLRFIDLIVNRGLGLSTFFYLSSLIVPSLLWIIIPLSLFISVIYSYNRLVTDSELIVLKSAGINRAGLIKPALMTALLATLLSYVVALHLLPTSYREFKDMQMFVRNNYASLLLQEGVFTSPTKDLTVYIRERGENGMLQGMLLHDNRNGKSITMMAERGQLIKGPYGPRFLLLNGNRQEVDKETGEFSLLYFDRYAVELSLFAPGIQQNRWREPEERYLHELFYPDDNTASHLLQKLRAEGHSRISWPLYNILLTMLALTSFITGEFNRRGQSKKIIISVVLAIALVIWNFGLNKAVANNASFTPMIYGTIIAAIIPILYVLLKGPTPSSRKK